jgi:simple sugar transport system ATP-binding protein
MRPDTPLVEMRNIEKFYGRIHALRNVNLSIKRGEIVGLLGDNGAGKSTLIKVLSGAVPYTSGKILIKGREVGLKSTNDAIERDRDDLPGQRARPAALDRAEPLPRARAAPGAARSSTVWTTRRDEPRWRPTSSARSASRRTSRPRRPIGSLSGGERQAVAIARAMYFDSDLIILDEPTNNLGVAETQGVLRFVRDARDTGHSCIFIAHNIHHVFQVVDRMVVMRRGTVVADDLSPRTSSIQDVEDIITGEHISA